MRTAKEYNDHCVILGEPNIGYGTWIGPFCLLDGSGGLTIGTNCEISGGTHIYTHSSMMRTRVMGRKIGFMLNKKGVDYKETKLGNNVYVGANCTILMGVTIGNNAAIGAGAVVTKDIPANETWVGVPAKKLERTK